MENFIVPCLISWILSHTNVQLLSIGNHLCANSAAKLIVVRFSEMLYTH
jgi:hypothetical protein